MTKPILVSLALELALVCAIGNAQDNQAKCFTKPPLINGTLKVPINGSAFIFCEEETNQTLHWYIEGVRGIPRSQLEIVTQSGSQSQHCILSNRSECSSMIALLLPKSHDLNGRTLQGCGIPTNNSNRLPSTCSDRIHFEIFEDNPPNTTEGTATSSTITTVSSENTTTTDYPPNTTEETTTSSTITTVSSEDTMSTNLGIVSITADAVSMYNMLINTITLVLLLLISLKIICGGMCSCRRKRENQSERGSETALDKFQPQPYNNCSDSGIGDRRPSPHSSGSASSIQSEEYELSALQTDSQAVSHTQSSGAEDASTIVNPEMGSAVTVAFTAPKLQPHNDSGFDVKSSLPHSSGSAFSIQTEEYEQIEKQSNSRVLFKNQSTEAILLHQEEPKFLHIMPDQVKQNPCYATDDREN